MGRSKELTETEVEVLLNAIDYTLETISPGIRKQTRPEWVEIHLGRAFQAEAFLTYARQILKQ
jgi:hypothetical protein